MFKKIEQERCNELPWYKNFDSEKAIEGRGVGRGGR